jgi:tetratricopeptide (TPR) repeat protein
MNPTPRTTAVLLAALAQLAVMGAARAADTTPSPPPPAAAAAPAAAPLAAAQAHLKAQRWAAALDELRRVNATGDADWNNLMGYALRKQAKPDLDGAQKHYDAALRINPTHMGTLEYAGELALMKRDLPTAEAMLARLQKVCPAGCEPLDDLKQAIAKYKAGGKG